MSVVGSVDTTSVVDLEMQLVGGRKVTEGWSFRCLLDFLIGLVARWAGALALVRHSGRRPYR